MIKSETAFRIWQNLRYYFFKDILLMKSGMSIMLIIGFTGQALFFSRFLIQWIISEKKKQSVIPTIFWYLSLGGTILLLTYALFRKDPVFIIGQAFGFFVYIRNIILIRTHKKTLIQNK